MPGIIRRIWRACRLRALGAMSAVATLALATAGAQAAYPERAITLIVPFAAGGPTDIVARIVSLAFQKSLGQSVVVENRAGAAGNIGMAIAARAVPDGYTLLLTSTAIAVNPALFKNLGYDPIKDFAPICELVNAPNVIVVRANSGINTLADLIARAKAAPGTFNYASPGAGTKSHLTGEQLKLRAGIDMVHVPYRGAGPAAMAVLEGTVQVGSVAFAAGRGPDQGRPAQGARGHRRDALVLASGRADHDRVRLSRISCRIPSTRCSRLRVRRRRSWPGSRARARRR